VPRQQFFPASRWIGKTLRTRSAKAGGEAGWKEFEELKSRYLLFAFAFLLPRQAVRGVQFSPRSLIGAGMQQQHTDGRTRAWLPADVKYQRLLAGEEFQYYASPCQEKTLLGHGRVGYQTTLGTESVWFEFPSLAINAPQK
jgi:hypothetical protein